MDISKFDYHLPPSLIAQKPLAKRDSSRLLVINRKDKTINHQHFSNLVDLLTPNDVLVLNNTKVFPARIYGKKETGGKVEILLTKNLSPNSWEALTKPGIKENQIIIFPGFSGTVIKRKAEVVTLKFNLSEAKLMKKLTTLGHTPLPPYIHSTQSENILKKEYQTVYAKTLGSVAAPTAGFHFTKNLLKKLTQKGITIEYITLHVSLGTFAPIKERDLAKHLMHSEYFELAPAVAKRLNKTKNQGKRIIAVGTTSVRVLETCTNNNGLLKPQNGQTEIFIYPPYRFKFVDALITNFHLPKSTLIALVSSFVSYPNTKDKFRNFQSSLIGLGYKKAIKEKYRFYSFGDACLTL